MRHSAPDRGGPASLRAGFVVVDRSGPQGRGPSRFLRLGLIIFIAAGVLRAAEPVDVLVQGAEKLEVAEILSALTD